MVFGGSECRWSNNAVNTSGCDLFPVSISSGQQHGKSRGQRFGHVLEQCVLRRYPRPFDPIVLRPRPVTSAGSPARAVKVLITYRELGRPVGQERGLRKLVVTR